MTRHYFQRYALPTIAAALGMASTGAALAQTGPGKAHAKVSTGAYSVVAEVTAKPGKEQALRAATLPLVGLVRNDPKSLIYYFQEDREKPRHFIFYEVYANQADFEAHNAQPYVQAWFAKLPDLADGGVKTMKMEILNGPGQ